MTDCIIGPGRHTEANPYSRIRRGEKTIYAHRAAWEEQHGPIPPGLTIEHTCWNKPCINVEHMMLVTPEENASLYWDRPGPLSMGRERGKCVRGHGLADAYEHGGKKFCRECHRRRTAEYRLRQRDKLAVVNNV